MNRLIIVYAKLEKHVGSGATFSCSIELYKLWYTLADFLPNWNFRGVFSNFAVYLRAFAHCVFNMHVCKTTNSLNIRREE